MPLLERDAEMTALREAVASAARGRGRAVLVSGSAGVGKTSVVDAVAAQVRAPLRVLTAACDDLSVPAPLGAVRDLAQSLRGTAARDILLAQSDVVRLGLALVAELSAPQAPAMLVVEDVHWADSSTVDVLTFLIRRSAALRVAVVVTYRHDDLEDSAWRRALGVLHAPHVQRLRVSPLSHAAVARLTTGTGLDPGQVHAATGGNPLYVREVTEGGRIAPTESVVDMVTRRLGSLPSAAVALAETLAVVPGRVERALVAALDEDRVLGALERRHVLGGDEAAVWFPHELVRAAVEATLPVGDASQRHAVVLRHLEAEVLGDVPAARAVHHALGAGDAQAVARYAPSAARAAVASGAHREASRYFAAALQHADLLTLGEELRLRTEHARELWQFHRFGEARAEAEAAMSRCRPGEDDALLSHALVSWAASVQGDVGLDAALAAAERAVAVLEPAGPSAELGWALCWLGAFYVVSPKHDLAIPTAERAMALGKSLGIPGIVGHALIVRGQERRDDAAMRDLERGIELVRGAGLRHHTLWGLGELGHRFAWNGDLAGAVAALRRSRDLAEDLQQESWALNALSEELATRLQLSGDWHSVERDLREALARPNEQPELLFDLHGLLGRLLARRGDPAARHHVDEAWRLAQLTGDTGPLALATSARLEEAWLTGHVEDVVDDVTAALCIATTEHQDGLYGELSVYAQRAGLAMSVLDECPLPWRLALDGDHVGAAVEWQRRGGAYEHAWELASCGDVERELAALRVLDELGAAGAAIVLRRRLRNRGVRVPAGPRAARRANPAGLTQRQCDVLGMLAEGLSDAEIADRLVLSQRTVNHHVSAVLQAFGARSRREAVSIARARGAVPAP